MHCQRFAKHEYGIRLSKRGRQAHLVEQVIDKRFENRKRALAQQGLRRADNVHVWNTEHFHRVGAVTVYKLLIYRIWPGVAHWIILMCGQPSLLPVQLDRIAENAERPARPWYLNGRQFRQLQQLQSLRQ